MPVDAIKLLLKSKHKENHPLMPAFVDWYKAGSPPLLVSVEDRRSEETRTIRELRACHQSSPRRIWNMGGLETWCTAWLGE
jgi:hypothetical protein